MGRKLVWQRLIGQERVRETLGAAFANNSLGHAYLLSGPSGSGKLQAALEIAYALHCERDEAPCYECDSCRRVQEVSHPDLHCVFPVALEAKHKVKGERKLNELGWIYIAEQIRGKIRNPYQFVDTPVKRTIPVEWIRELNQAIWRGTVRAQTNVAIIGDVDLMNASSANAMLKTLEEPPPNTVMFLLTERPHAVLPTIQSRCQIMRLGAVSPNVLAAALAAEFGLDSDSPGVVGAVQFAEGSYGRARLLVEESLDVLSEQARTLYALCVQEERWGTLALPLEKVVAEHLAGGKDLHACEKLIQALANLARGSFLQDIPGSAKYIHNAGEAVIALGAKETSLLLAACEKAVQAIRSRANVLLVLATFLISLSEIAHGEERQTG